MDIFATILELTAAPSPEKPLDGVSLLPLAVPDAASSFERDNPLFWRFASQWAAREGKWKYLRFTDDNILLFNMLRDPFETRVNYWKQNKEVVNDLKGKIDFWNEQMPPDVEKVDLPPFADSRPWSKTDADE